MLAILAIHPAFWPAQARHVRPLLDRAPHTMVLRRPMVTWTPPVRPKLCRPDRCTAGTV
jgi:hypothetical protein